MEAPLKALITMIIVALTLTACTANDPSAEPTNATQATTPAPAVSPAPGDHVLTMTWEGIERRYEVHAPAGYRPGVRLPLVVVMHYKDGSPTRMREMTKFDAKADKEGFLVAYPEGLNGAMNALICCGD